MRPMGRAISNAIVGAIMAIGMLKSASAGTLLTFVIEQSACTPTSREGFTMDCQVKAYTVTDGKRDEWQLFCGKKKGDSNACAKLVAYDIWPFAFAKDSKYCTVRTLKGKDGKDYPVKCVTLGGDYLFYSIMKYDDFQCTLVKKFCKK